MLALKAHISALETLAQVAMAKILASILKIPVFESHIHNKQMEGWKNVSSGVLRDFSPLVLLPCYLHNLKHFSREWVPLTMYCL